MHESAIPEDMDDSTTLQQESSLTLEPDDVAALSRQSLLPSTSMVEPSHVDDEERTMTPPTEVISFDKLTLA
jgi:hypothetical protein